jgi:hypothetical protein
VDRLDDKGAHVRKSAIQLITSLLENNPYSPQLPLSTFRQNLSVRSSPPSSPRIITQMDELHFINDESMNELNVNRKW